VKKKEIYYNILNAFKEKYSFLGELFAEEFLLSLASSNIQNNATNLEFRIRRHILLFWQPGYVKSTLLLKGRQLIGRDQCNILSDISIAALRGSVESGQFVPPVCLKYPISMITEFGQLVNTSGGGTELVQKLLNVLEEGTLTVSLIKAKNLFREEKEEAMKNYGVTFDRDNNFTYSTNWVVMAGTYNKKFLSDTALESRFVIVSPDQETQKLTSDLTKHINRSDEFYISEEVGINLRKKVFDNTGYEVAGVNIPDEVYNKVNLSVRDSGQLMSAMMCRNWWEVPMSKEEVINKAIHIKNSRKSVWTQPEDLVFKSIVDKAKSMKEICSETGLEQKTVYKALNKLRAGRIHSSGDELKFRLFT